MAKLSRGFDQTNLRGSVGAVTYRRQGGITIASQKVPMNVKAKQTRRLMAVRMKWANLVALWKSLNKYGWHPSFIKPNKRVSDFNRFMSVNVSGSTPVYLPKNVATYGGGVASEVVITEGTLPTINVEFGTNGTPSSDIALGTLNIGNSTTLKAFSDAVINNNQSFEVGDQLTIVIVRQLIGADGIPFVESEVLEVTLANGTAATTVLLGDVIPVSLLSVADGTLALSGPVTGAVAFVHSRIVDGETVCSRQSLVANNATAIAGFTGETAFVKAVNTYGGFASDQILTPNVDEFADTNINP